MNEIKGMNGNEENKIKESKYKEKINRKKKRKNSTEK